MIDKETYVDIQDIRSHFGDEICAILPAYHSITGCDTTSYPSNVGKIRPFKKMMTNKSMHLLQNLGKDENSFKDVSDALIFYHTVMYSGKPSETITETRVRMFQSQKDKSSVNLISDEASIIQHLLRADLQTYIWKQCTLQYITLPSVEGRGWYEAEGLILPVWFQGDQLPPSLSRSKKRGANGGFKTTKPPPCKRKSGGDEQNSNYDRSSSSSSISDLSSDTSSGWKAWDEGDIDSDSSSDDDPDW